MAAISNIISASSDLRLWFKLQNSEPLAIGDVQQLIPLRWTYLRDNWQTIKPDLETKVPVSDDPNTFVSQILDLEYFIDVNRNNSSNPFNASTYDRFNYVFDSILTTTILLTAQEEAIVNDETDRVSNFGRNDFLRIRQNLVDARDLYAGTVSGSDATYDAIYGRSSVIGLRSANAYDIQQIKGIQDGIRACDYVLSNPTMLPTYTVDPFALARSNANNPNYLVNSSNDGILAQLRYGETLANVANRYLGSADRWMEIAIANGLKPPYIDEIGETLSLTANGSGNQVSVAATDISGVANINKLAIGQPVFLRSATLPFDEQRSITNISVIPVSGEIIVTLDGAADLDRFTTVDSALIQIYKLNTINSRFLIMIPAGTSPTSAIVSNEEPWFLRTKAADLKQVGVDLALDENNDLAWLPTGDLSLSYGLNNAAQALKIKFSVERGELQRSPEFGLVNVIGKKMNDFTALQRTLTTNIVQAVKRDSRFSEVTSINISRLTDASGILVNLVVRLSGSGTNVPLTFKINTQQQ